MERRHFRARPARHHPDVSPGLATNRNPQRHRSPVGVVFDMASGASTSAFTVVGLVSHVGRTGGLEIGLRFPVEAALTPGVIESFERPGNGARHQCGIFVMGGSEQFKWNAWEAGRGRAVFADQGPFKQARSGGRSVLRLSPGIAGQVPGTGPLCR